MKRYVLGVAAVILAVAGSAFAFQSDQAKAPEDVIYFHYKETSDNVNELRDYENNWEMLSTSQGQDCGGTDLPCVIEYDGTEQDFEDFLSQVTSVSDFDQLNVISEKEATP